MNGLISREAAIKLILSGKVGYDSLVECPEECNSMLEWAADEVAKMPSAQPVVRCKDCKWYEIYQLKKDGTDDRRYKPSYCVNLAFHAQPDWYCADGERKEDERT